MIRITGEMYPSTIVLVVSILTCQYASGNVITSIFGSISTEQPQYTVVSKTDKYEIRRYGPQLWAEVDYMANPSGDFDDNNGAGFQPLFRYISGRNDRQKKIPMTTPVIMQRLGSGTGRRRMAFVMPASQYSRLSDLPQPTDSKVILVAVNEPLVLACIRFSMSLTNSRIAAKETELREAASANQVNLVSEMEAVRVAGYNPPWTLPPLRKNDICIPLVNQA